MIFFDKKKKQRSYKSVVSNMLTFNTENAVNVKTNFD